MNQHVRNWCLHALMGCTLYLSLAGQAADVPRVLWTESRVAGSPEPPPPFQLRRIFPTLKFDQPLFVAREPTSERLLVVQRQGQIVQFVPGTEPVCTPFLDVGHESYSLCFHPRYADNGYLYVFASEKVKAGNGEVTSAQNRIVRYTVRRDGERRPDPGSETVILRYQSNGHNGHHLLFGPDGFLYISSGDGTVGMDPLLDGQNVTNLRGTILRIDVDRPVGARPYSIPRDNPFLRIPEACPEIFAFGMRNPYRMAFDPAQGKLWVADIGQDLWEMIYLVEPGTNCGWSIQEGSHPLIPDQPIGPAPITPPIVEHPHAEMRSITGGYFYQGRRFPDLRGAYLYGDYDTGKLFGVRYDYQARRVSWQQELADTTIRIISINEDRDGEPILADFAEGGLYTIEPAPPAAPQPPFPRRLSETGIFDDVAAHRVKPGLIPYEVNAALWSDGTHKERFIGLPGTGQMEVSRPDDWRGWRFPQGTVLVKTFSLDTEPGVAGSRRRIETRLLTLKQGPQGGEWVGYSYRWNASQTDAELVEKSGRDEDFLVRDASAPGGQRVRAWHYPSRAECMTCHTREARYVLGATTLQLNRHVTYDGRAENQLVRFQRLGVLSKPLPSSHDSLPRLVDPYDPEQPLEARARSYLHANCAHCHVSNGGGNSELVIDFLTPLDQTKIIDVAPQHKRFGQQAARAGYEELAAESTRLIAPGAPARSLIHRRMALRGQGQMPPLATAVVDEPAVRLFDQWIRSLPATPAKK